jgi:hypothetical protein
VILTNIEIGKAAYGCSGPPVLLPTIGFKYSVTKGVGFKLARENPDIQQGFCVNYWIPVGENTSVNHKQATKWKNKLTNRYVTNFLTFSYIFLLYLDQVFASI